MTRRRTSVRAAAIRRAHEAKAQRDAERLARERSIEAALADYFEAADRAAAIRAEARRKADKILADAEASAGTPETAGREAVRHLRALTGSHAEAAGLCGLSVTAVRTMLRADTVYHSDSVGPESTEPEGPRPESAGPPLTGQETRPRRSDSQVASTAAESPEPKAMAPGGSRPQPARPETAGPESDGPQPGPASGAVGSHPVPEER